MSSQGALTLFLVERLIETEARLSHLENLHKATMAATMKVDGADFERQSEASLVTLRMIVRESYLRELRSRQLDDASLELITQTIQ